MAGLAQNQALLPGASEPAEIVLQKCASFPGDGFPPAELFTKLKDLQSKNKGKGWGNYFDPHMPIVIDGASDGEVSLKCKSCKKLFKASNPANLVKTHVTGGGCIAGVKVVLGVREKSLSGGFELGIVLTYFPAHISHSVLIAC